MMEHKAIEDHYSYCVRWSSEDGEYVGTCAELPGLSWLDVSPAAALNGIEKVAGEAVTDMERTRAPSVWVR
ncbi:hypothetical protein JS531_09095 [Bifidobacterium sp. CP2]|uniref:hypothetical protein n=1 Tax=Bifidobacterium sp. CP2 TaxID=2809025 RepID=UPI001BDD3A31|nr:hypothetical protein [Bifidobacterium sp. CP2]MBT1182097.1 hypothetical protein [Bifidobacterium sp. CP2]